MPPVTPADVFRDLWAFVRDELRATTKMDAPVSYNTRGGAAPEDEAAYVREATCIWLYRDEPLPDPDSEPEMSQPDKDACLLAHEYGHYLSDKAGRPEGYMAANDVFIAGGPITEVELALVLDEERLAWSHARSELAKLGVTEWSSFNQHEKDGLDAYEQAASPKGAPASVADSVVVTQAPAIPKWFPLGEDGDWLQEAVWSRNLHLLRDRRDGVRALDALRTYFTPAWSKAHQLDAPSHPVVRHAISIDSRYRLLEVGLMLAEMNQKKRLRQRLLP
ncbi:MAG: hypothetical protein OK454_02575, partial [Thaumarchaeota archaeon]|nr:hypothetical protein [Nitrososphaerota archaeon]